MDTQKNKNQEKYKVGDIVYFVLLQQIMQGRITKISHNESWGTLYRVDFDIEDSTHYVEKGKCSIAKTKEELKQKIYFNLSKQSQYHTLTTKHDVGFILMDKIYSCIVYKEKLVGIWNIGYFNFLDKKKDNCYLVKKDIYKTPFDLKKNMDEIFKTI